MKAWTIEQHGGSEVLVRKEVSALAPGPGEALVQVEAVGLNHLDLWVRNGVPGHKFHLPIVPGGDIAGKILSFGPGRSLTPMAVGTPVILNPGVSCGACEACLSGADPLCRKYGILGETQNGGCADQIIVPVCNLIHRPENVSAVHGASLSIAYLTAWTMLVRKAKLQAGETILIHAGGSGVSVAAIQIAKLLGATVITTVRSERKAAQAKALGADRVIQTQTQPLRDQLGKIRCEVVLDHVGADTFYDSVKSLAWGGRLVTCGATSGAEIKLDLKQIFFKNITLFGSTMGSKADLIRIVQLVSEGKLRSVVDQVLPMSDLPKAFELLESRALFGKVVLTN